jgi:hypothetical protein
MQYKKLLAAIAVALVGTAAHAQDILSVDASYDAFGPSANTFFTLTNTSGTTETNISLLAEGGYSVQLASLAAGQSETYYFNEPNGPFTDEPGDKGVTDTTQYQVSFAFGANTVTSNLFSPVSNLTGEYVDFLGACFLDRSGCSVDPTANYALSGHVGEAVAPVPLPPSLLLMLSGLLGLGGVGLRRGRALAGLALAAGLTAPAFAQSAPQCPLTQGSGPIKHIVYLQFDNVHYQRDNVNVPSDLEQMPTLLSFLKNKGTLLTNDHTQIISHTADGIITSITGVYPDRHGQGVSNSYDYFKPTGKTSYTSSFVYWTDKVQTSDSTATADHTYALINEAGQNAPAPWAAYTKAGCDFGAVSLADMEFENVTSDIANVFGTSSPEYAEGKSNQYMAIADFEGIAIHCAQGSALCSSSPHAAADVLPQEPGDYTGFQALFGHKYVVPAINNGSAVLTDLLGGPIQYNDTYKGTTTLYNGFPGFDGMSPKVTLSYVAQMLEAGVPVVYGYLSDAHDAHLPTGNSAYGPGEQGYTAQLQDYDRGWQAFFTRLKNDGIDETNTLFIITVEEGDHFVGGNPSPKGCDGVTVYCTYAAKGEVDLYIDQLLSTERGNTTGFDTHYDMSPNTYIYGNPSAEDPVTRQLERDMLALTAPDPAINNRTVPVISAIADRVEQRVLHMTNPAADPLREPSFTPFGYQDFYISSDNNTTLCNPVSTCVLEAPQYAWNHGGVQAEISKTWLGLVGPGVNNDGIDGTTWTDHVDYRPTILALAGIKDSYVHDGRVVVEHLNPAALPAAISNNLSAYEALATAYKQLTAPFGAVGTASLTVSTKAVAGTDPTAYSAYETTMATFLSNRDALANQIKSYLDAAMFSGGPFDASTANSLASQANALAAQMLSMAKGS